MKLKKHGAYLIAYISTYVEGEIQRWDFDLDYSGYVIEHYPKFEQETPRLAAKFANTIEAAYSNDSWMSDDAFLESISDALDEFLGITKIRDIW